MNAVVSEAVAPPLKLDLGAGKNKHPGFLGVDAMAFDGVDVVHDLRVTPWPWADDSVTEVHCSHFLEHLTGAERVAFMNELYRVMKVGAQARIICPNWSNECAYGDPTHQWPPLSSWAALYWNKGWRDQNAPHVGYTCDFDFVSGCSWEPWLEPKNHEYKMFAISRWVNSQRDLIFTITKRAP